MKNKKENSQKRMLISVILLLAGNILFFLTLWLLNKYDKICFDQVLFQTKTSSAGVHRALLGSAVFFVGGAGLAMTAIGVLVYLLLSGRIKRLLKKSERYNSYSTSKLCMFFKKRQVMMAIISLVLCTVFLVAQLDVVAYAETVLTGSDFIEEHYADPNKVELTFPEEKRNLVYIFLESMENTFSDISVGPIDVDHIPELTALAEENISFSHTSDIGGAYACAGTTWTAAAMVSQTAGMPVKVPFKANVYGADGAFMPGIVSIGEILEDAGYTQALLVGSDADFHGRKPYFVQHGNYEILDINSMKAAGRLDEDYREWWGFEDEKLFAYAKEELTRLASEGDPFNLTMLTADTHFPDGYRCRLCEDEHDSQYANVLSCSSKQVYEFVSWIKEQSFYENTTVIISGDHLTMDSGFLENLDAEYVRTTYNCIINSASSPVKEKKREFATFDMFPTTLSAMGVKIEGDRLGLGTDLFSDRMTLIEEYGFEYIDPELQKRSSFYNTEFLGME